MMRSFFSSGNNQRKVSLTSFLFHWFRKSCCCYGLLVFFGSNITTLPPFSTSTFNPILSVNP